MSQRSFLEWYLPLRLHINGINNRFLASKYSPCSEVGLGEWREDLDGVEANRGFLPTASQRNHMG